MKSKSLIKLNTPGLMIMVLIVMIACRLDIQENRSIRELVYQGEIEIISKIGDVDSKQSSSCYFAFSPKNSQDQLIIYPFYNNVLKNYDRINILALKNQKQIELSTNTKKSLLFYYSHIHFDTEYHEIIS